MKSVLTVSIAFPPKFDSEGLVVSKYFKYLIPPWKVLPTGYVRKLPFRSTRTSMSTISCVVSGRLWFLIPIPNSHFTGSGGGS